MGRSYLGFPPWLRIWSWLTATSLPAFETEPTIESKEPKNPQIPRASNYNESQSEAFWQHFPFRDIPLKPSTRIDFTKLAQLLKSKAAKLLKSEILRGERAVKFLSEGAPSFSISELPSVFCRNASSALEFGYKLTDTIAEWVKEGFVAGPFSQPPFKKFRVNSIMMVPQKDKVRPILNVSSPKGSSFNDNVDPFGPEKVSMSSAKQFSWSILDSGKNSIMCKFDMRNAYKNVPCMMKDLWLQGFKWCNKFFLDISQIFGASSAVSNFDTIGHTIKSITHTFSRIPKHLVHKQLDDIPLVAPKASGWCEEFSRNYRAICDQLNIPLAPLCPKKDKAFENSEQGKVLGIEFNSVDLTWRLPEDKRRDYLNSIIKFSTMESQSLVDSEEILGKLNFVVPCALS